MEDLMRLQNGSDIRGISLSGVDGEHPNLSADEAVKIARGFLLWLCKKTGKTPDRLTVAIGRDPRLSGKHLLLGLINGFGPYGPEVLDCGLASTPAMFMSTVFPKFQCDGAIMITASHLPFNRNGFKFFDKDGGLNKNDISQILQTAMDGKKALLPLGPPIFESNFQTVLGRKTYPSIPTDLMDEYCSHLRGIIKKSVGSIGGELPLSGLKIVVDAGNGSGGFFASQVLAPLGADVSASQFLTPDGTFPNHPPNPENAEAMHAIGMAVLSSGADFGLIFDTDVDRSAAVDGKGSEISRNRIVALAASLVAEDHPGTTVVTDSITSNHLTDFLEGSLGLHHLRFKRGYKNVINKAIELNAAGTDCQLAIETSGHAALKENYFLDDGAYLATKIVVKAATLSREGKTIDQLLADLRDPAEEREVRMDITSNDFGTYGEQVLEALLIWAVKTPGVHVVLPNFEGIRLDFDLTTDAGASADICSTPDESIATNTSAESDPSARSQGWCLLRKSLHDPLMALNMESDLPGGCKQMAEILRPFLASYPFLDISKL
jgi:phosphomannomutase